MSDGPAELRFLVTGTARSGTTLIQRLCCELPSVWVPAETHFWAKAAEVSMAFDWPLRGEDRHAGVEYLLRELAGGELPVTAADVVDQMMGRHRRIGLWTVFESLVAAMSPPDRMVLGEKTPNHMFRWEQLQLAAPDLKLLVVVRDPRAVLRSHRGVAWGERDAYALAERWIAHQRTGLDALRLLGPERVMIVRYEDATAGPAATQSRIAGFLGVADEPEQLRRRLVSDYPLFPAREEWKARALELISTQQSSAHHELSREDLAVVEAACGRLMETLGYPDISGGSAPVPEGESLDRVLAFRRWHASVTGPTELPIY